MKNKLLLTTALVGLGLASVANAQTTVSGNLAIAYKAAGGAQKANSFDGFAKESQINIANKGKLSNGMDYAAGTSLEFDGRDDFNTGASGAGIHTENTYIDFISGGTTFTISADHIQNSDFSMSNISGYADFTELADGIGGSQAAAIDTHNSPAGAFGVGVMQKTAVGTISALFVPSVSNETMNDITNTAAKAQTGAGNTGFEIGFRGDLGVKNLDAAVFYNKTDTQTPGEATKTSDLKGKMVAAKYTLPMNLTVAAEHAVNTATTGRDIKTKSTGLSYALNKELTIGYVYAKTDTDAQAQKEKIQSVNLGYNLGPVVANVQITKGENIGHTAASDGDSAYISLTTRF
jgi:hypothetical protein